MSPTSATGFGPKPNKTKVAPTPNNKPISALIQPASGSKIPTDSSRHQGDSSNSHPNPSTTIYTPNFVRRRRNHVAREEEDETGATDSLSAYRHLCELRMRRLERYKKTKSLCSLNMNNREFGDSQKNPSNSQANTNLAKSTLASSTGHLAQTPLKPEETHLEWNDIKPLRYPKKPFSSSHSNLLYQMPSSHRSNKGIVATTSLVGEDSICVDSEEAPNAGILPFSRTRIPPTLPLCLNSPFLLDSSPPSSSPSSSSSSSSGCGENNNVAPNNPLMQGSCVIDNKDQVEERNKDHKAPAQNLQFEMLREKMISLMENDVQLLQQLLTLGDTIQELRREKKHLPAAAAKEQRNSRLSLKKARSDSSLSSAGNSSTIEEENDYAVEDDECSEDLEGELKDEWRPMDKSISNAGFSQSMSAITHLYVGNEEEGQGDVEDELRPNIQYFSRKNSVLRIPIPPRASNRMLGKRLPRRPSELIRCNRLASAIRPSVTTTSNSTVEEDSGHSSTSNSPSAQCSPTNAPINSSNLMICSHESVDSGRGLSSASTSTDGGSSRFSTFSSVSSTSTSSSNNLPAHVEAELERSKENMTIIETEGEPANSAHLVGGCASKCRRTRKSASTIANELSTRHDKHKDEPEITLIRTE